MVAFWRRAHCLSAAGQRCWRQLSAQPLDSGAPRKRSHGSDSQTDELGLPWFVLRVVVFLALGALNLVRGSIHLLASDGDAGQIAGINLSQARDVIVFLFAIMGLQRLAFGALDLMVAFRYRVFVPLLPAPLVR